MGFTWEQVHAWRMRRQFLAPRSDGTAADVVGRLCGVQAQVWSAAATAVALRQSTPDPDALDTAFADLSLMKTWAMRGTLHLLRPAEAGAYLSLMETTGFWLKPSWQKVSGIEPGTIDDLTEEVGAILDGGAVLTRDELVTRLVEDKRFARIEDRLRSGWGQTLKPLAWRGVLCHGPMRGNKITFTSPARQYPDWEQRPEPDDAAPVVIEAYLGTYGPAAPDVFDRWLSLNATSKPRLRGWFGDMGDRLTEVEVEGRTGLMLAEDVDELGRTTPFEGVRLLGGFDQYILGPGTKDEELLPGKHRTAVSRQSGWISPIVVRDGRIAGVWEIDGDEVVVTPFAGGGDLPGKALTQEASHVARASGISKLGVRVA